jgi:hypothetical protein
MDYRRDLNAQVFDEADASGMRIPWWVLVALSGAKIQETVTTQLQTQINQVVHFQRPIWQITTLVFRRLMSLKSTVFRRGAAALHHETRRRCGNRYSSPHKANTTSWYVVVRYQHQDQKDPFV